MTALFTLLPLIFGISTNNTNTMYPTYQYSVHLNSESYVSCPTYSGRTLDGGTTVYTFYNTIKVNVEGDLYFNNDNDGYYIPNLVISCEYSLFVYNTDDDTYDYLSYQEITLDTFSVSSSSSIFLLSDSYEFVPTFPNTVVVNRINPLNTSTNITTLQLLNDGLVTWVNYTPSVRFNFGDTDIIPQVMKIRSLFVDNGYSLGFDNGYNSGYQNGFEDGNSTGYQNGYQTGYTEASTQNQTAVTIFSGIISIALIPINFFLACLNFEVFGINIGSFVSALLTVAIVVIITRMILSGGNGGGDN